MVRAEDLEADFAGQVPHPSAGQAQTQTLGASCKNFDALRRHSLGSGSPGASFYQRSTRGPSAAPSSAVMTIPAEYQTATKAGEISPQAKA